MTVIAVTDMHADHVHKLPEHVGYSTMRSAQGLHLSPNPAAPIMADAVRMQVRQRAGNAQRHPRNPGCPELQAGRPAGAQQHLQVGLLRQRPAGLAVQHQRVRLLDGSRRFACARMTGRRTGNSPGCSGMQD